MRHAACSSWINLFRRQSFVFLTGDLGFGALEPLREVMKDFFVNAGIAEQNMICVAAGMARLDMDVWTYSIGPFSYARPFEQIRNDVCQHRMPVAIVGNGGGYGYGSMGSSHHALEDYGTMLTLPNMHVWVPIFAEDVDPAICCIAARRNPAYLRLGRCERPPEYRVPPYAPWRCLMAGSGTVILAVGPLTGGLLAACLAKPPEQRPLIWGLSELPISAYPPPEAFLSDLKRYRKLIVVEEHVVHGGAGQMLAHALLKIGVQLDSFIHLHAQGYPSGTVGSQAFHRRECGLDPENILGLI